MELRLSSSSPGNFRSRSGARAVLTVNGLSRLLRKNFRRRESGDASCCDSDPARAIFPSAWLTAFVAVVSILLVWQLQLAKQHIRIPYVSAAFLLLPIVMVLWAVVSFVQLIVAKNDKPISEMWARLRYHGPMMVVAVVIFPLFLAAYTICKSNSGSGGIRLGPSLEQRGSGSAWH